ncbi:MAG TPA: class I SAM-dependent rRNA methyltransferase [Bacteroidales bacterium]|nr:class I SAM-dependent rRNA methyltransferase [Bacteroidales bacterium]
MNGFTTIFLKPGKEQSVMRMHPWIFSGAIKKIDGKPAEGDIVEVFSSEREFLAMGHYQVGSIAIRLFSFDPVEPGKEFWKQVIRKAYDFRATLNLTDNPGTNVYRLINGEGDGLPGLIIDYYNGIAVMQMHSIGMYRIRKVIAEILAELYGKKLTAVYDKSESTLPFKANLNAKNEFLIGSRASGEVIENGHRFGIDAETGQKTGFFIDQRENRELLTRYIKDKDVLNMFCYTGGFSVYASAEGARLVHSVDSSAQAIELTDKNIQLNNIPSEKHQSFATDAFSFLNNIKDKYDVIILDPPAFAKHQDALNNALMGYKRLNQKAIEQVRPGGIIFTFSCSQVVTKENFRKSVFAAAANSGREVRILHQLTQPPDHPISIYHPEGEYLKGLVIQVE